MLCTLSEGYIDDIKLDEMEKLQLLNWREAVYVPIVYTDCILMTVFLITQVVSHCQYSSTNTTSSISTPL